MNDLKFREATKADIPAIVTLVNNCYRGDTSRRGWTTEADLLDGTRTNPDDISKLLDMSVILVCTDTDEIIGSVNLEKRGSEAYLGMLVVNPDLQRGGIGKELMKAAEDFVKREWGSEKMTMTVITSRSELLAYYERRGYRRTGEIKPFKFDDVHGIAKVDGIELEILEKNLKRGDSVPINEAWHTKNRMPQPATAPQRMRWHLEHVKECGCRAMPQSVLDEIMKRFDSPDETRKMIKGRFDVANIEGLTVGKATYEPGWKWSEHVGPALGQTRCAVEHLGLVISGSATVAYEDHVDVLKPGERFYVPPNPHDSWVVGDSEYVSLHFVGADRYSKK